MKSKDAAHLSTILQIGAAQVNAFNKRERSRAAIDYATVMGRSAIRLKKFAETASFDLLLMAEKVFQQNDQNIYAQVPSTLEAVQKGMQDFDAGEDVYKQLLKNPKAYKAHRYREDDHAPPDRLVPLDAMRKALRGQRARIGNYRKTVLGSSQEYDFMSARIEMLRRAEQLYDSMQREQLL